MSAEANVRKAWAAFVEAARAAEDEGFYIRLPNSIKDALAVSTTAKVYVVNSPEPVGVFAGAEIPAPDPIEQPEEEPVSDPEETSGVRFF